MIKTSSNGNSRGNAEYYELAVSIVSDAIKRYVYALKHPGKRLQIYEGPYGSSIEELESFFLNWPLWDYLDFDGEMIMNIARQKAKGKVCSDRISKQLNRVPIDHDKLVIELKKRGLTQKSAAEKIGFCDGRLSKGNVKNKIPEHLAKRLETILGIKPEDYAPEVIEKNERC